MRKKLQISESRSRVDFTTNSNPLKNVLLHHSRISSRGTLEVRKRLFYYVWCAKDKDGKYPFSIPFNAKCDGKKVENSRIFVRYCIGIHVYAINLNAFSLFFFLIYITYFFEPTVLIRRACFEMCFSTRVLRDGMKKITFLPIAIIFRFSRGRINDLSF